MVFTGFSPYVNILNGYMMADDEVGATSYYGYTDRGGNWYILRSVRFGAETTHTYAKGTDAYATNWTNRKTTVSYDTFTNTF